MEKQLSSKEIADKKAQYIAEAEALQAKCRTESLSPEEDGRLDECISSAEKLNDEYIQAERSERIEVEKARMAAPARPAPKLLPAQYRSEPKADQGEGLRLWLQSFDGQTQLTTEDVYRARSAGFSIGSTHTIVPVDWRRLNFRERATLTTGGATSGAEWVQGSYSNKVIEYLTAESPLLGLVSTEVTADGQARDYTRVDDTALEATPITASSGTEANPTIPTVNVLSGKVQIKCFAATSGYQVVSYQELRDAHVNIPAIVAKASARSIARKMEKDLLIGAGDGLTGVEGLLTAATDTEIAAWSESALRSMYFALPAQYRSDAFFVSNSATFSDVYDVLHDDVNRSLFNVSISESIEFNTLFNKKWVLSEYMPADTVLFFSPQFYQFRMVAGQKFDVLREKYYPHTAWVGLADFGGAWLGPDSACLSRTLA